MKKFIKNNLIGIIIGIIISGTVGVIAATTISSKNVTYQNKTVNNALDELYDEATTGKELVSAAITNKGVTTTSSDTYETMATNINNIDTNNSELNQKINNLESKYNSDIASLTGSISNLNQNLTNLIIRKTYEVSATKTLKSGKTTTLIELPNVETYIPTFAYVTNGNISAAIILNVSKINNIFTVIAYNTYDEDLNVNYSTQITVMYERSTLT